jgi:hypothetical protein
MITGPPAEFRRNSGHPRAALRTIDQRINAKFTDARLPTAAA